MVSASGYHSGAFVQYSGSSDTSLVSGSINIHSDASGVVNFDGFSEGVILGGFDICAVCMGAVFMIASDGGNGLGGERYIALDTVLRCTTS